MAESVERRAVMNRFHSGEPGGRARRQTGQEEVDPRDGPASSEQIMKTTAHLLRGFICDQIEPAAMNIDELGPEPVSQDPYIKKLGKFLKRKAQEIDNDKELQRMMDTDRVFTDGEIVNVAREIFSDGFTCGGLVAFFWFISKLVLKTLYNCMPELIRTIIDWALDFFQKQLLTWIQKLGGWEKILIIPSHTLL